MEFWVSRLHWMISLQILTYIQSDILMLTVRAKTLMTWFKCEHLFIQMCFLFICLIFSFLLHSMHLNFSYCCAYFRQHSVWSIDQFICSLFCYRGPNVDVNLYGKRQVWYLLLSEHHIYVSWDHFWHCKRNRSHWHRPWLQCLLQKN